VVILGHPLSPTTGHRCGLQREVIQLLATYYWNKQVKIHNMDTSHSGIKPFKYTFCTSTQIFWSTTVPIGCHSVCLSDFMLPPVTEKLFLRSWIQFFVEKYCIMQGWCMQQIEMFHLSTEFMILKKVFLLQVAT
jgi:hypothetical protein